METRRPLQPMATGFDAPAVAASSTFMQAHPPDPAPRARADGLPTYREPAPCGFSRFWALTAGGSRWRSSGPPRCPA